VSNELERRQKGSGSLIQGTTPEFPGENDETLKTVIRIVELQAAI
jgi:hypothetical protein